MAKQLQIGDGGFHAAVLVGGFRVGRGLWNSTGAKEQVKMAFDYFKANASRISGARKVIEHDFHLHVVDLQNSGVLRDLSLASLVALSSGLVIKPTQSQMVVLGDMSLGGSINPFKTLQSACKSPLMLAVSESPCL